MARKAKTRTQLSKECDDRKGRHAKSYKLEKKVTEKFKQACDRAGVPQAIVLTRLMTEYIEYIDYLKK